MSFVNHSDSFRIVRARDLFKIDDRNIVCGAGIVRNDAIRR